MSYDLHAKRHVYRRSGVREYIVWRVLEQAVDWFRTAGWTVRADAAGCSGACPQRGFSWVVA